MVELKRRGEIVKSVCQVQIRKIVFTPATRADMWGLVRVHGLGVRREPPAAI